MNKKEDEKIDIHDIDGDVVFSKNQTGGITAHTVNFEKPQRKIDEGFKKALLKELSKHVTDERPVKLSIYNGYDSESLNLYNQIKEFLADPNINFDNDSFSQFFPSTPIQGVKINLQNPKCVDVMIGPPE